MNTPIRLIPRLCLLLLPVINVATVAATEYFVATDGCDTSNDGIKPGSPFATIQRGVNALEAGDTLTVAPGEYFESVRRNNLGGPDLDTVIRAEIAGTAVLRGDRPAPPFTKVPGYRFVYVTDFTDEVQAVNELQTLTVFESTPGIAALEFLPGSFYHDADAGKLYISTGDLRSPVDRTYTISVLPDHGLYLADSQRVIIDGFAVTGFNTNTEISHLQRTLRGRYGIFIAGGRDCVIRNCRAWLNGRGIGMHSYEPESGGNVIERCVAWANSSRYGDGAAIVIFNPTGDIIRDSTAFLNPGRGIEFYGSSGVTSYLQDCLAWGNGAGDLQMKGGDIYVAERCVALDSWAREIRFHYLKNCLIGSIPDPLPQYQDRRSNNIVLTRVADVIATRAGSSGDTSPSASEGEFDPGLEFADPLNHDYRLQADSRFRGTGIDGTDPGPFPYQANVFYLSPDGADAADGLSIRSAWATLQRAVRDLRPGDTLYVEAGSYGGPIHLTGEGRGGEGVVSIRGRGFGQVVFTGQVAVDNLAVEFMRLDFQSTVQLNGASSAVIENCRFGAQSGIVAKDLAGLRVTHCEFYSSGTPAIVAQLTSGIFSSGNIFAVKDAPALRVDTIEAIQYSDYNGFIAANSAWQVGEEVYGIADPVLSKAGSERYSIAIESVVDEGDVLPHTFGPYGQPMGIYSPQQRAMEEDRQLVIAGPFIHSVSDTTANIEWWLSGPTNSRVEWAMEGQGADAEPIFSHGFVSYSMSALEPDTNYRFRLIPGQVFESVDAGESAVIADESITLNFSTLAMAQPPVTLYVAPDGNDDSSGLSRSHALRSVNRAASIAGPGDTVRIAGGNYQEAVYLRTTGSAGRPITFTSIDGEKVVFDGDQRALSFAFLATHKDYIHIDGFYFKSFQHGGSTPWVDRIAGNGSIILYGSSNVEVSRCFHDGRGPGYGPGLIIAVSTEQLLVHNSVICDSMGGGVNVYDSADVVLRNNVFLRNKIAHVGEAVNRPDQLLTLHNNIFTDSLPIKVTGQLFNIGSIESLREFDNCYFFRIPAEERVPFMFYGTEAYRRAAAVFAMPETIDNAVITELTRLTLPDYQHQYNPDSRSFSADPEFARIQKLDLDVAETRYLADILMSLPNLDFHDLFATNPTVRDRDIGLQPEVFASFSFDDE